MEARLAGRPGLGYVLTFIKIDFKRSKKFSKIK